MSLHTLQRFPEERLLDVECTEGVITVIVWCHHILATYWIMFTYLSLLAQRL